MSKTMEGYFGIMASGSFQRPNDTTVYTSGDAVTNSTTAPIAVQISIGRVADRAGTVLYWKLTKNGTGVTNANFRLWLFNQTVTPPADNAAYSPAVWANREKLVGYVDFTSMTAGSDGAYAFAVAPDSISHVLAYLPGTTIYGILQA